MRLTLVYNRKRKKTDRKWFDEIVSPQFCGFTLIEFVRVLFRWTFSTLSDSPISIYFSCFPNVFPVFLFASIFVVVTSSAYVWKTQECNRNRKDTLWKALAKHFEYDFLFHWLLCNFDKWIILFPFFFAPGFVYYSYYCYFILFCMIDWNVGSVYLVECFRFHSLYWFHVQSFRVQIAHFIYQIVYIYWKRDENSKRIESEWKKHYANSYSIHR